MGAKLVTIDDVSQEAGVSSATVSRVISNNGYVSAEARQRVERAIAALGYVPNAMARGLKTRRSGSVALLVPEIINSFYTTLARGAEDVANDNGLHLILGNTDEKPEKERVYAQLMIASRVEGVLVASAGRSAKPLKLLAERELPTVLVDRVVDGFKADIVRGDSFNGAIALTEHLLALGHSQIALINGHPETSVAADREAGYREAMRRAGIKVDDRRISRGAWFVDDAEQRVAELLENGVPITAIFGANNFMAIGALRALRSRGLRVPEDVALVSFDDIEVAAEIDPFLTVMSQPAYSMGTLAMGFLIERILGKYQGPPRELVVTPRLIQRRSCGASLKSTNVPLESGNSESTENSSKLREA
ncbi:MAG: LacI family DNA-binding transcriptional regulator [Azospirillaceae bacterium]